MLPFEDDLDTSGRNAARRIEDVGGDRAHERAILAHSPGRWVSGAPVEQ
jgi:hypothetical protein